MLFWLYRVAGSQSCAFSEYEQWTSYLTERWRQDTLPLLQSLVHAHEVSSVGICLHCWKVTICNIIIMIGVVSHYMVQSSSKHCLFKVSKVIPKKVLLIHKRAKMTTINNYFIIIIFEQQEMLLFLWYWRRQHYRWGSSVENW